MNWEYMKHKQIYFVEIDGEIIKFKGFDALEEWVKKQPIGKEWVLYFVQAYVTAWRKKYEPLDEEYVEDIKRLFGG